MKILGFLMITLSSAVCGLCYVSIKEERMKELEAFSFMLELIRGELEANLCPLPELSVKLAAKVEGKAHVFLTLLSLNFEMLGAKAFEDIWCESLNMCCSELNENEKQILSTLGKVLGKYDISFQCVALENAVNLLQRSLSDEKNRMPQLKHLTLGISASAGAMLAILLI